MLTAAIGAAPDTIDAAYDIERMYKYLDYVHVMCYDYHGKWDKKTGHNSPLMPRPDETGQSCYKDSSKIWGEGHLILVPRCCSYFLSKQKANLHGTDSVAWAA